MRNVLKVLGLFLLLVAFSCKDHLSSLKDTFQRIDIDKKINNLEIIKLSQFTNDVKYLPIKSEDYFELHSKSKCEMKDSLILLYDLNGCKLFNSKGIFLNNIGTKGRGPEEYQFCIQACFSKHNTIYMQANLYNLLEYRLDGSFIKKYDKTFRLENSDDKMIYNWELLNDSLFFGHVPNTSGQIEYKAVIIKKNGEILHTWKNYDRFPRSGVAFGHERDAYLHYFNGMLFLKQYYNDTLFYLNSSYELIPKYYLNIGNLKMPASVRLKGYGGKELWSYISIDEIFQTHKYLFLNCLFGDRFPAKRLTPNTPNQMAGSSWYNTTYMLGIVDKHTSNLVFCKPISTDNPLFTTGIQNDIDAGPRFIPKYMVNDSTMIMWVSAIDLKKHIASDDFKKNRPKYIEKKNQLEKLANSLDEMDNPVLIFVTFNE